MSIESQASGIERFVADARENSFHLERNLFLLQRVNEAQGSIYSTPELVSRRMVTVARRELVEMTNAIVLRGDQKPKSFIQAVGDLTSGELMSLYFNLAGITIAGVVGASLYAAKTGEEGIDIFSKTYNNAVRGTFVPVIVLEADIQRLDAKDAQHVKKTLHDDPTGYSNARGVLIDRSLNRPLGAHVSRHVPHTVFQDVEVVLKEYKRVVDTFSVSRTNPFASQQLQRSLSGI